MPNFHSAKLSPRLHHWNTPFRHEGPMGQRKSWECCNLQLRQRGRKGLVRNLNIAWIGSVCLWCSKPAHRLYAAMSRMMCCQEWEELQRPPGCLDGPYESDISAVALDFWQMTMGWGRPELACPFFCASTTRSILVLGPWPNPICSLRRGRRMALAGDCYPLLAFNYLNVKWWLITI